MRVLQYAISGAHYYKKQSIFAGILIGFFIFVISLFYNLRSSAQLLYAEVLQTSNLYEVTEKTPFTNARLVRLENIYHNILIALIIFFVLLFLVLALIFLRKKMAELVNWRLLGFSSLQIWTILFLEMIIPTLIVSFIIITSLAVFDRLYESLLQFINYNLMQWITGMDLTNQAIMQTAEGSSAVTFSETSSSLFVINFGEGFTLLTMLNNFARSFAIVVLSLGIVIALWQFISLQFLTKKLR